MTIDSQDTLFRSYLTQELDQDRRHGVLHLDRRLTSRGRADWPHLLLAALSGGTVSELANELRRSNRLIHLAPPDALSLRDGALALAEAEVARFRRRAVCRQAIAQGHTHVEVYRAHPPYRVRQDDVRLVGRRLDARQLLTELRMAPDTEGLTLSSDPDTGLSIRVPPPCRPMAAAA